MFGLMVSGQRPAEIAGMLGGVSLFIAAYTILECSSYGQKLVRNRLVKIVSRIGYGIRMLISVVFPLGSFIDIPTGVVSISIANFVYGTDIEGSGAMGFGNEGLAFVWFLSTTVIQGILLNIILFIFMLIMFGIGLLFSGPKEHEQQSPWLNVPK